ncbi:hypothetical protein LJK88_14760 [Paenibacillus sp. P26]|nr:hypothetical protein LJK88_14760 [Paenibacillus sp. P26]UUZ96858.1 hypothetical protein LJK87_23000 [Paenibacillus sp. P25]
MSIHLDISGKRFDNVGFGESHIFLNVPNPVLVEKYSLFVWGIDIDIARLNNSTSPSEDFYVSGISKLTFYKPKSVRITIYPYKDKNCIGFLHDQDKRKVKYQKSWSFGDEEPEETNYYIAGVLDFPLGYVEIEISSLDQVMLEMDSNHCIPVKEYTLNPHSYAYDPENPFHR